MCRLNRTYLLSTVSHIIGDLSEAWSGVRGIPRKSIVFRRPNVDLLPIQKVGCRGASKALTVQHIPMYYGFETQEQNHKISILLRVALYFRNTFHTFNLTQDK
jgi:hypothetical protein